MPMTFQDIPIFLKGTMTTQLCDPMTGDILVHSTKSQTNNIQTSANLEPIRSGIGNGISTIIGSDSDLTVENVLTEFSILAKAYQVGARLSYNGIKQKCITVSATGDTLQIPSGESAPVADYGLSKPTAYVLEVGVANHVADMGVAYEIDLSTRNIKDFTAVTGKTYKIWYTTNQANARVAELSTNFNPKTVRFVAEIAGYANQGENLDESSRCGTLRVIIPLLKLGGKADITGAQTTPDTTSISGRAIAADSLVESAECTEGGFGHLAYYVWIPFDATAGISGLAVVGGAVDLGKSTSKQIPVKGIVGNELIQIPYGDMKYTATGAPTGTTVSAAGKITAGATAGDFEVKIDFPSTGVPTASTVCNVSVH